MRDRYRTFAKTLVILAGLLAACAPAPSPAPTRTPAAATPAASPSPEPTATLQAGPDLAGENITIHHVCDSESGLAAFNMAQIWAAQDLVAAINSAGGVFGAELQVSLVETGGSAEGTGDAYGRLLDEEHPLVIIVCDAETEIHLAPLVAVEDIPTLGPGLAPLDAYQDAGGALFAYRAPVQVQFMAWMNYLIANWADLRPEGAGEEIRLAIVTWPAELGGALDLEAAQGYAADLGVDLVLHQELPADRATNVYDFFYTARDANVNAIYTTTRAFTSADLLNAVHALGLAERFVFAGPDFAFDALDAYLLDPAHLHGVYLTSSVNAWSQTQNPAISLAHDLFAGNDREAQYQSLAYLHTLAAVDIARHALETVLLEQGWDGLNARALRAELRDLEEYPVLGGLVSLSYRVVQTYPTVVQTYVVDSPSGEMLLLSDFAP